MSKMIHESFYYDEESPSGLRWKIDTWSGPRRSKIERRIGDAAGHCRKDGYWMLPKKYGVLYAHRAVALLHGHDIVGRVIDHKDGNPSNNVITNLRVGSTSQNCQNAKMRGSNTTGFCGVTWCRSKLNQDGSSTTYATCSWYENGINKYKRFSTKKYGILPAFALAVQARQAEVARLNKEGANYTERHGVRS